MTTLQSATSQLAAKGAVLHVWNSPVRCFLVGELQWIDLNRMFWFTAHGDREDDGHVLEFDRAEFIDGEGVQFFRRGSRVGLLTAIGTAAVDDPEDYSVAFSLWQQVAPCTRPLIERARERFECGEPCDGVCTH
jgi:hypothetical protein